MRNAWGFKDEKRESPEKVFRVFSPEAVALVLRGVERARDHIEIRYPVDRRRAHIAEGVPAVGDAIFIEGREEKDRLPEDLAPKA